MPLQIMGPTSGSVTIQPTDTFTNTLTLPTGTGTLLSTANPQSGGVIQVVQGSSSIQNITASAVSIGTNTILLNTANPAVRYGVINVIDSGSSASTGSLLWDSTNNVWIYVNPLNGKHAKSTLTGKLAVFINEEIGRSWETKSKSLKGMVGYTATWEEMIEISNNQTGGEYELYTTHYN